jgi:hypothetical protein
MRVLALLAIVAACGGTSKRSTTSSTPASVLAELHSPLDEPIANAQVVKKAPVSWQDIVTVARRGDDLVSDAAVRHRAPAGPSWQELVSAVRDDGTTGGGAAPATPITPTIVVAPEQLVVEMWLDVQVDDAVKTAAQIGERVVAAGGRVVSSNAEGTASVALVLRVPPGKTAEIATWLAAHGRVESKRTLATDVSKEIFDRDLALQNLRLEMVRLEKLAERNLELPALLDVEKEITRVRGEIERIEGEQRFLADRVQYATINLTLAREASEPPDELEHANFYPGARLATLVLLDPGMSPATRVGGGATLRVSRLLTFDLDLFPSDAGDSRAVLATFGTALYSDYFGWGRRSYLNPFLGARAGYGYLSGRNAFALAGELGVELYRQPLLVVEASALALALARDGDTVAAFEGVIGASVPF